MKHSETYNKLFTEFRNASPLLQLEDYPVDIMSYPFHSSTEGILPGKDLHTENEDATFFPLNDLEIKENQEFHYHIFVPRGGQKYDKAIFLMHGLNEKNWKKYLPWALDLTLKTGTPVILFPFAFHMDRAPLTWSQPRIMQNLMIERKKHIDHLDKCTFANVALSHRLDNFPHRFYLSGYQTASDIMNLMVSIKNGLHPVFKAGTQINLFAYSIGAFLSQIMLIADNEQVLAESKIMLFCGGSVFQEMVGESKLIMDSSAFSKLLDYFINNLETDVSHNMPYTSLLKDSSLGKGFRSMIGSEHNRETREIAFNRHADKIKVIGLKKDMVIPADKIKTTVLGGNGNIPLQMDILDFPFEYSHEVPFPVGKKELNPIVDHEFNRVFNSAAEFLS